MIAFARKDVGGCGVDGNAFEHVLNRGSKRGGAASAVLAPCPSMGRQAGRSGCLSALGARKRVQEGRDRMRQDGDAGTIQHTHAPPGGAGEGHDVRARESSYPRTRP